MVTAGQALSGISQSRPKAYHKHKIKERPQFKATEPEPTDFSKVLVKTNGHGVLALVVLHTQSGDLIDCKYVHLNRLLTRLREKQTLASTIKGSQGTIDKECTI